MNQTFSYILLFLSMTLFAQEDHLLKLLPSAEELQGYEMKNEPEYYQGDDLFYLINGGADIYMEYGFKDVISASYEDEKGDGFKAEIYQMSNDSAAYGIFSFNRNEKTIYHDIGDESVRQDDFLIFIKGHYYVVLTTQSNQEVQHIDLLKKAKMISTKIKVSGSLPTLVAEYDQLALNAIYLRGNLALSNIYLFDFTDIFQFTDGLYFKRNDVSVFIFNYPSTEACELRFQKVKNSLQSSTRFLDFEETETGFSLADKKSQIIQFTSRNNRIYVFIGENKLDMESQEKIILE